MCRRLSGLAKTLCSSCIISLAKPAHSSHTSQCVSTQKPKLMLSGGQHFWQCGTGPPSSPNFAWEIPTSRFCWMHLGTWAAVPSSGRDGYSFAGTLYPLCQLATVNPTPYSGHSLRSGAVSTAAVTSIQDSLIYIGQVADLS